MKWHDHVLAEDAIGRAIMIGLFVLSILVPVGVIVLLAWRLPR